MTHTQLIQQHNERIERYNQIIEASRQRQAEIQETINNTNVLLNSLNEIKVRRLARFEARV